MFDLRTYLPYLLNRVGFAVTDAFSDTHAETALTVSAWRVLAVLLCDGAVRIGELAELTSLEVSTLSRLVDALQRRHFVLRKNVKTDARMVSVSLTDRGRAIAAGLLPAAVELEGRLVQGMSAAEVAELKRLLDKLYSNIAKRAAASAAATRSA